jgi:hypothetical protein
MPLIGIGGNLTVVIARRSCNELTTIQKRGAIDGKVFVITEKGVIEETVEHDDLGHIIKLSRKPDHWERLLGDPMTPSWGTR